MFCLLASEEERLSHARVQGVTLAGLRGPCAAVLGILNQGQWDVKPAPSPHLLPASQCGIFLRDCRNGRRKELSLTRSGQPRQQLPRACDLSAPIHQHLWSLCRDAFMDCGERDVVSSTVCGDPQKVDSPRGLALEGALKVSFWQTLTQVTRGH